MASIGLFTKFLNSTEVEEKVVIDTIHSSLLYFQVPFFVISVSYYINIEALLLPYLLLSSMMKFYYTVGLNKNLVIQKCSLINYACKY